MDKVYFGEFLDVVVVSVYVGVGEVVENGNDVF